MEIEKTKLGKQTVNKYITFYEDFVTYGKEKITCPVCNSQTSDAQMLRGFLVYELIKS
jgi:NADH:ubiquinone oxidoreductase subunit E